MHYSGAYADLLAAAEKLVWQANFEYEWREYWRAEAESAREAQDAASDYRAALLEVQALVGKTGDGGVGGIVMPLFERYQAIRDAIECVL